jgi:hypothetical protein
MSEEPKRKGGRPMLQIDPDQVEKLASIGCTKAEICAVVGCSQDTLMARFSEQIAKGQENGKTRLRKKQIEVALAGNVSMLIFLGKNMLGQSDAMRNEITGADGGPIQSATVSLPPDQESALQSLITDARARVKKP